MFVARLAFVTFAIGVAQNAAAQYVPIEIVDQSGRVAGQNEHGQVVGDATDPTFTRGYAFSWTPMGGLLDLGTLGGLNSQATAVNNQGQVVGFSSTSDSPGGHAFLWTATQGMVDLGTLGGTDSDATDINNSGQIVGSSLTLSSGRRPFLWTSSGGMVNLGSLGGMAVAYAISNSGHVVGVSELALAQERTHAFVWTPETGMVDLGTLGGDYSVAAAVNSSGQVVGSASTAGGPGHAFLWTSASGMVDLGTLGGSNSSAHTINEKGQVVGLSELPDGRLHGFFWTPETGMLDLGTLGGSQTNAVRDVNEDGYVVGLSTDAAGEFRGFIWHVTTGMLPLATLGGSVSDAFVVNDDGQIGGMSTDEIGVDASLGHPTVWVRDRDTDTVPDFFDNCPDVSNDLQLDADGDGVGDACEGTADLAASIRALITRVESMHLHHGLTRALMVKLEQAAKKWRNGQHHTAVQQLQAFIKQVGAQAGKKIPAASATELSNSARAVANAIQEGKP